MFRLTFDRRAPLGAAALLLVAGLAAGPAAASGPAPSQVLLAQAAEQLPPRMRTALIRGLQEELNGKGYGAGPVDGVWGARTRAAIRSYQRDAGLRVTGQPSKELLDHLKFSNRATERREPPPPTAAPADADLVRSVQRELQVRGYYRGAIDGVAGPNTGAAVRAFQRDAGFSATGKLDQRLLTELRVTDPNIRAGN